MSDLRPKSTKITLGGEEYGLLFSIKAVDEIQDHFDMPILDLATVLSEPRKMYKNAAHILAVLINANIDCLNDDGEKRPYTDEAYITKHFTTGEFRNATKKIFQAFIASAPEPGEDSDPQKGE